jgi:hypothetical protein
MNENIFFTVWCAREIIVKWQTLANIDAKYLDNTVILLSYFSFLRATLMDKA